MPINSGADYIESLRGRNLRVYLFGELVAEPVDHPMIRPSVNAVAKTYDLANENPTLASVESSICGIQVNRFLHVTESVDDVVMQNRIQRKLGQLTGTCIQRCVGMDAINSLHSVTHEIDEAHGTGYHARFKDFVRDMQEENYVIGAAMTDPKGDRGMGPSDLEDPDIFVHISERREDGLVIRGAKAHQTGCINSHWIVIMPTMRLREEDKDYAVVCAVPVDDPGLSFIYGRQSNRRFQRGPESIPHPRQADRDDPSERDHIRVGPGCKSRIVPDQIGQLPAQRYAGQCVQAQCHPLSL